jgi:hypothetical protein
MFVQDGFFYMIVTKHKLTVQKQALSNSRAEQQQLQQHEGQQGSPNSSRDASNSKNIPQLQEPSQV